MADDKAIISTTLLHKLIRALHAADAYLAHPDLYNRHETHLDVTNALTDYDNARKAAQNRR